MVRVFTDEACRIPVSDGQLFEGRTYFLDLGDLAPEARQALLHRARLLEHVDFHPRNPVCALRLDGHVGQLDLAGAVYDLRSQKLDLNGQGAAQFTRLLQEVDGLRAGLLFRYGQPTSLDMAEIRTRTAPSTAERLHFFAERMVHGAEDGALVRALEAILRNPTQLLRHETSLRPLARGGRVDARALARQAGRGDLVPCDRAAQAGAGPRGFVLPDGSPALPAMLPVIEARLDRATPENRFVLFALREIEALALAVLRPPPGAASEAPAGRGPRGRQRAAEEDARALLRRVRGWLAAPALRGLTPSPAPVGHSTVLMGDTPYGTLYRAMLRSRLSLRDRLTELHALRRAPLKDMATLYEIWVFLRVAEAFLGSGPITAEDAGAGLAQGTVWSRNGISVGYNCRFGAGRAADGSYSVELRPDVSVRIGGRLWFFDAKYRARATDFDPGTGARTRADGQNTDLVKMHGYVDAVAQAAGAVALYPGSRARLYPRDGGAGLAAAQQPSPGLAAGLAQAGGVGAVPLLPLGENAAFNALVQAICAAAG